MREYLYKILVVGDLGTGKTSIIRRYVHNIFSSNYKSTVSFPLFSFFFSFLSSYTSLTQ
jgi:GTPase SAR1 family protein